MSFAPFQHIKARSRYWKPAGFHGFSVYHVMKNFAEGFSVPYLTERAAAISYNFILSVPPTCLFLFTLAPNLPFISKKTLRLQLHSLITDIIPSANYNEGVIKFMDEIIMGSKFGLLSFTFVLSLLFASNAVIGIMRSFNKDYIGFKKVKGLKKRWKAIKLTVRLFALTLFFFILMLITNNILDFLGVKSEYLKDLILFGKWLLLFTLIFYTYGFVYKYAPSTTRRWKLVSPGAIIATCLSILATVLFSLFVSNFGRYNLLYGSIGTIMVVMIMIFLNSLAVLIGFEFNLSIHTLKSLEEKSREEEMLKKE